MEERAEMRSGPLSGVANALFQEHIAVRLMRALDSGGAGGLDGTICPGQLLTLRKLAWRVSQAGPTTSFMNVLCVALRLAPAQMGDVRDHFTP
jgi:hypothetical protein